MKHAVFQDDHALRGFFAQLYRPSTSSGQWSNIDEMDRKAAPHGPLPMLTFPDCAIHPDKQSEFQLAAGHDSRHVDSGRSRLNCITEQACYRS